MDNELDKVLEKILEKVPKDIDFGFIAVKNEVTKTFQIENNNKFQIPFEFDSSEIYKFNPSEGNLPRMGKIEIKITMNPQSAIVCVSNAQLILGKEANRKSKIIKISSISKYPYLKIHKTILDYGNVVIGKTKELDIIINNPEKVPAIFFIEKKKFIDTKIIEQFYVNHTHGIVPPNSSYQLKVKYVTSYPNFFSYETFDIITKGGNVNRFNCIAHSLSLNTNISERFVNFFSVELNESKTKMIRLFNESDELTYFQFFYNNDHVFILSQLEGVVPGKSNVRVTITFKPKECITYYDRIFCLMKNHFLFVRKI
jgi:hypothetical protein